MSKLQFLKFGSELWDPSHRFETSWLLPPWVLFGCRALIVSFLLLFSTLYFLLTSTLFSLSMASQPSYLTLVGTLGSSTMLPPLDYPSPTSLVPPPSSPFPLHNPTNTTRSPDLLGHILLFPRCRHPHLLLRPQWRNPPPKSLPTSSPGPPPPLLLHNHHISPPRHHRFLGRSGKRPIHHQHIFDLVEYVATRDELRLCVVRDHLHESESRALDTYAVAGHTASFLSRVGISHTLHEGHLCLPIPGLVAQGPEQRGGEYRRHGRVQRGVYCWNRHRRRRIVLRVKGTYHPSQMGDGEERWYDGQVLWWTGHGSWGGGIGNAETVGEAAW